jgi:hypothetical protein
MNALQLAKSGRAEALVKEKSGVIRNPDQAKQMTG